MSEARTDLASGGAISLYLKSAVALVLGVGRGERQNLLQRINKAANAPADLKT